jgi:uncharacterized membrane protein
MEFAMRATPDRPPSPAFDRAAYCLGFSLGGFFDGIVLHQILQWHHLLSAIRTGPLGDLRGQVMADGLFHALMYLVAAVGLYQLVRSRAELSRPASGMRLLANACMAFGAWHVVDAVLSHWILGIHRIRMDVSMPLLWDLAWLVAFGVVPLLLGAWIRKRFRTPPPGPGLSNAHIAVALVATSIAAGAITTLPNADSRAATLTVVLRPDVPPARLFDALEGTEARILWSGQQGSVWVLRDTEALDRFHFYRFGAMYVSGSVAPAGCSAWFDPSNQL